MLVLYFNNQNNTLIRPGEEPWCHIPKPLYIFSYS